VRYNSLGLVSESPGVNVVPSYVRVGLYFPSSGPGAPRAYTPHPLPYPCPLLCVSRYAVGLLTLCRMHLYCAAYCVGVGVGRDRELQLQLPVVAVRGAWWWWQVAADKLVKLLVRIIDSMINCWAEGGKFCYR